MSIKMGQAQLVPENQRSLSNNTQLIAASSTWLNRVISGSNAHTFVGKILEYGRRRQVVKEVFGGVPTGWDVSQILSRLGIEYRILGKRSRVCFERILPICDLEEGCLSFINDGVDPFIDILQATSGSVVLVERSRAVERARALDALEHTFFVVDNPRLVVAQLIDDLRIEEDLEFSGVHQTALVDGEAKIHPSVAIGPFCVIGRCVLEEGVSIGPHTVIGHNVHVGRRTRVREHCTIGGYGFGFVRAASGCLERFPHIGSVVIEAEVELFPYVNVDRGTLTATKIRKGAKLDHYVHVGHNSEIGEDAIVTAGVVLCGGSTIGARCWIGVGAIIKEKVAVGSDCTVGLGAVVLREVEAGAVVAGIPARLLSKSGKDEGAN